MLAAVVVTIDLTDVRRTVRERAALEHLARSDLPVPRCLGSMTDLGYGTHVVPRAEMDDLMAILEATRSCPGATARVARRVGRRAMAVFVPLGAFAPAFLEPARQAVARLRAGEVPRLGPVVADDE